MIIDVNTIDSLGRSFEFSFTDEDLKPDVYGLRLDGAAKMLGSVRKVENRYSVIGKLVGRQTADCTRCLGPVSTDLSIAVDVDFVDMGRFAGEQAVELSSEDLDADELLGQSIDLAHLAREQIILNIPEQVFCREDCKGLCEKCGQNLNLLDCNCGRDDADPRWAALRGLTEE